MEAIDYKEALDRFCYVSEKQQFYNKITKKPIKEASLRKKIQELYPNLVNKGAKLDLVVSEIKQWAYTPQQLTSSTPDRSRARSAAYSEVKDYLPMVWRAKVNGENQLFYINGDNEVTFAGQVSFDNFVQIIKGADGYLTYLKEVFESGTSTTTARQVVRMSRFEDYLRMLFQEFQYDPDKQIEEEPPIITHDPVEIAYKRFNPDMLTPGETPTWDQFLSRLDYPEIFLAWVWSIFEPKNLGRQILWMQGEGNDGKSTAIQTITEYLGEEHTMPIQENVNSQFFYSNLYGKRLATFGDCKSPRYIAGSKVHSLVGGDYVSIERKGEQAFSAFIRVKMLIASNLFPQIDFSMPNEYTRLLLIKVKPQESKDGDVYFKQKLSEEKWQFLAKCREMYEKHCPAHAQIAVSEEHFESMQVDCGSDESSYVLDFMDKFLIIDLEENEKGSVDARIRVRDLHQKFDEMCRMNGFSDSKLQRMKRDLASRLRQQGVEKKKARFKKGSKSKVEHAYVGVKLKTGDEDE